MEVKKKYLRILYYVFCTCIALIFIFPIYYTFINSIRNVYSTPAILTPKDYDWINYKYAITLVPFFRYLKNSVIILLISVPLGMVMNFLYGYALAKLNAPGSNLLFFLVLCTMMIPSFATQIPQYIMFSKLGLTNTFWIWLLEALAGTSYQIFLCRQYLLSLPSALVEAAVIDGATQWKVITKIIMPLSKPLFAIGCFNLFNFNWGDYMTPYMYLSEEKYPLIMPLFNNYLYVFPGSSFKLVPVVNAAALIIMIPTLIMFFLCQKQMVQGVTSSGVKG